MPTWDELFKREEFRRREPYPRVSEFAQLLKERAARRVLDLGCGTGRHLILLAKEGFEVYGLDISPTGLEEARRWLEEEGLRAELKEGDMSSLPYPEGFFDGAISIHVIYHGTLAQMRKAIGELHRTLRPGGLALLTFQSRRSYRYGRGEGARAPYLRPRCGPRRRDPAPFQRPPRARGAARGVHRPRAQAGGAAP
jgi:tellurite methyltransferase